MWECQGCSWWGRFLTFYPPVPLYKLSNRSRPAPLKSGRSLGRATVGRHNWIYTTFLFEEFSSPWLRASPGDRLPISARCCFLSCHKPKCITPVIWLGTLKNSETRDPSLMLITPLLKVWVPLTGAPSADVIAPAA
jgi:hypothetical protein